MIFCAMLVYNFETSCEPTAWMLLLILCFSDLARLLLRKSEVAQRYRTSSGVIPSLYRYYHFR